MLNSVEHEILNAHTYINIKKSSFFQTQISRDAIVPAVGIFKTFINRKKFMLNRVEHEKSFITSGPEVLPLIPLGLRECAVYELLTNEPQKENFV